MDRSEYCYWVRLPLDVDGVPILPGDDLVIVDTDERITVWDIELYNDGRWLVCDDETMDSIHPDRLRHYVPPVPTVEDVLREFADDVKRCCDTPDTIAAYAARLRLADDSDKGGDNIGS